MNVPPAPAPSPAAPLHRLGITDLAPLLRTRQVSPVEVVRALLARIERLDGHLRTYITVTADRALAEAQQAEEAIRRGEYRGPLHGVPLGLKDLFHVAGVPTTFGSRLMAAHVAAEDATVTRRLAEAGAVLLGKHNLHEFAFGTTSENPHHGAVRNPWDPRRVAGGSSGGTAAAIAAGLCAGGLGSDTGGSIRIPAALCGISGFKPTYGLVSRFGALPLSWSLDHVGPMARSVADCAALLRAIAGPDPRDPTTAAAPPDVLAGLDHALEADVAGLRLGIPLHHYNAQVEPAVAERVRQAIATLEGLGARVEEVPLPNAVHAQPAGTAIMGPQGAAWHGAWLRDHADAYSPDVLLRFRTGALVLATDYLKAQQARTLLQADFAAAFRAVDVVVAPTVGLVAPPIGTTFEPGGTFGLPPRALLNRLTVPANLAGLPAASVPCGFVDGLPVGLQVIAPAWQDALALRVAHAYQRVSDWHTRRPPE